MKTIPNKNSDESIEDTEKQFLDAGRKLLAKAKTIEYKLINKIPENENKFKCHDCGTEINEGEFKTFAICDSCWDKFYEKNKYRSDIQIPNKNSDKGLMKGYIGNLIREYSDQEILTLRDQLKEKDEIITALKNAMKKGNELYAKLKFDDEPFTPYQLALQEIESLKQQLSQQEAVFKEATRVQYEDSQKELIPFMDREKFLISHIDDLVLVNNDLNVQITQLKARLKELGDEKSKTKNLRN